jgi:hypothetical protein
MRPTKLPVTDSIEELASFWDSHGVTAFESRLEEVTEPVFERQPSQLKALRLELIEFNAVQRVAQSLCVQESELVREWVLVKLGSLRG